EEVVVEHVDQDAGGVPEVAASDAGPAAVDERGGVGEGVDRLVLPHPVEERGRHREPVPPFDEVRQKVAEAELDVRLRQERVRQPVQGTPPRSRHPAADTVRFGKTVLGYGSERRPGFPGLGWHGITWRVTGSRAAGAARDGSPG